MKKKVILVIIDGLSWSVAHDMLGFLQGCREAGKAALYQLRCELPSLSRPLYECILTGVPPIHSGIVGNNTPGMSKQRSIFHLAQQAGLRTAAACYSWVSELYNRTPYEPLRDCYTDDAELPIQHGIFYHLDDYPDEQVLIDAEVLRLRHDPDFLLVHTMGVDDCGHRVGIDHAAYRNAARAIDKLLAGYIPAWLAAGYNIVVTSDHGMNRDGKHGGIAPEEREVALFTLGDAFRLNEDVAVRQTELCGLCADLLGIPGHNKPHNPSLLIS